MSLAPLASPSFNDWLQAQLQELGKDCQAALGTALWALVLGGGYGRGEGGVVIHQGQERPYNDIDLFLLVRRRPPAGSLAPLSRAYHERLGVDVDFSRPYRQRDVAQWPSCQMFYDLVRGHQVLAGDTDWVKQTSTLCWLSPPELEASRLLLNRGAGLLWALRVQGGLEAPPDSDFARRNLFKLWQALGDALLLLYGQYQAPYAGRELKLKELLSRQPDIPSWPAENYARSLQFRLQPTPEFGPQPSTQSLLEATAHWLTIFLHCEGVRLGAHWSGPDPYLADNRPREPRGWKNLARNLRAGRWGWEAPRQPLYLGLVRLLAQQQWHLSEATAWLDRWRRTP